MTAQTDLPRGSPPPPLVTRLGWSGDLDVASGPQLAVVLRAITRALGLSGSLDLDLSRVTFLDCSGLAPLLSTRTYLADRFRLLNCSAPVERLLRLAEVRELFTCASDQPGAGTNAGEAVEQAKGLVMATYHCDADDAFDLLLRTAGSLNVQLRVLAVLLVRSVSGNGVQDVAGAVRALMESTDPTPAAPVATHEMQLAPPLD